jgi:FAD:protein FMN transferase
VTADLLTPSATQLGVARRRAWGTSMTIVVRPGLARPGAERILDAGLDAVERACSRFRPDAEIWGLSRAGGSPVPTSALLFDLVTAACEAAERTDGAVDPTVGRALETLGYDRDFDNVVDGPRWTSARPVPAPGWRTIALDSRHRAVGVPPGVVLDLGATAKAWTADHVARRVAAQPGVGALVALGGDVAMAGPPPPGGWPVGIALDSATPVGEVDTVVAAWRGGIATSSTTVRTWQAGGHAVHHIVDPATGDCASRHWLAASVAAPSCVDANAASTAAIIWGEEAPERLEAMRLPARLIRHDGVVLTLGGWPHDGEPHDHDDTVERR